MQWVWSWLPGLSLATLRGNSLIRLWKTSIWLNLAVELTFGQLVFCIRPISIGCVSPESCLDIPFFKLFWLTDLLVDYVLGAHRGTPWFPLSQNRCIILFIIYSFFHMRWQTLSKLWCTVLFIFLYLIYIRVWDL